MSNATQSSNAATQYREVQRKANAGERIKIVNAMGARGRYSNGDELVVDRTVIGGAYVTCVVNGANVKAGLHDSEYVVLEPIASAAPNLPDLFAQFIRDNAAAVRSYLAELDPVNNAEPNEKVSVSEPQLTRAKVIEMARERVAELGRIGRDDDARLKGSDRFHGSWFEIDFVVNREKRAVTALVYNLDGLNGTYARYRRKPDAVGIAKCAPDDVFNADIGKAIAAERALGLTLTDAFVNAPKPAEPVVGMIVRDDSGTGPVLEVRPRGYIGWQNGMTVRGEHGEFWTFIHGKLSGTIIDDTDADYAEEGVKDGEAA